MPRYEKCRGRKAREDIRPVFITARYTAPLTIFSSFSGVGRKQTSGQHKRTSSKKLRDVPMWPPTVSPYLENLNYATVIKAPVLSAGRTRESEEVVGSQREVAVRTFLEIPREGREFLRKESRGAFPRDEADDSFFFFSITPPFVPPRPCLSFTLVLSLASFFPSTVSNPDVGRYKLMKCLE